MTHPLALPEVLTLREASSVLDNLLAGMAQQPEQAQIRVSASPLRKFDSSALAVLLECRRAAIESGRDFGVDDLPSELQGLATVYGVASLVGSAPASAPSLIPDSSAAMA